MRKSLKNLIKRDGLGILKHVGKAHTLMYGAILEALAEWETLDPIVPGDLPTAAEGLSSLSLVLTLLKAAKTGQIVPYPSEDFELKDMKV